MSNRTSTQSSRAGSPVDGGIRKRVGKACDRCRMKKSRCDGSTPCTKCKADNSICVYGRRKRSTQDKVYPKGYVEMLEHQQAQLVLGLQELYRRLQDGEPGDSGHLAEVFHDTPTTHELLEWLGALHHGQHDGPDKFYDDPYMMQAVAILENTDSAKRDASFSSIQSEMDPSTSFETEALQTELDFPSLKESYASQASFVDSPQEFSVESTLPLTYTTTVEPARPFSQVTWQQDLTNHSADSDAYNSWIYNTEAQIVNNAQASDLQQPADTSINPCLTLRDWSELYIYNFDKGYLYT